jgi:HSP20 family protein
MSDYELARTHIEGYIAKGAPSLVGRAGQSVVGPSLPLNGIPIDVYETASYLVVRALVPGAGLDDLDATVDGDGLRLTGYLGKARTNDAERLTWHCRGIEPRRLDETIPLPVPVDLDRGLATYGNGVLTVQFPKVDQVGARRIPIRPHYSPSGLG